MKKGRNTAEKFDEFDDIELLDEELQSDADRTIVLKAAPPSRRMQLLAHGALEVRCSLCQEIKPLASAEDSEEGWVCKECVKGTASGKTVSRPKGKVLPY